MVVEVVVRTQILEGDGNWFVETTGLCGAEHWGLQGECRLGNGAESTARGAGAHRLFSTRRLIIDPCCQHTDAVSSSNAADATIVHDGALAQDLHLGRR